MADRISGKPFATRSEVLASEAMVASSQPLATQAGLDIMRKGGNAIDAAIAVNACLGLMEPTGCGIGGDLFVILWDAETRQLHGLNASGRSASGIGLKDLKAHLDTLGEERIPRRGPLSISVPGCIDGWFALNGRFGKLPMADILSPAIHYAEEGFPLSEVIAYYWEHSMEARKGFPGFLDTFTVDGTRPPAKGELWRNPALANTYRRLGEEGRDVFYKGELAETMAACLRECGSFLRKEDFAQHHSEWTDPVSINYRGFDVWELPPNGQGIAALEMLNILKTYDLAGMGFGSADHLHYMIEAKKLAYADRANCYADPHFHKIPLKTLLSDEYADRQRARIRQDAAARTVAPDPEILASGDTVYLCTADSQGNMVSFIQSNFWGMGSGVCPPGLGFGFQNRGTSFSLDSDHANAYAPAKRPFHTIIPAFLTRAGEPLCAFGVMGGDMQPQAHVQIVSNIVDFGMNLQEAGDAPRWHHHGDSEPDDFTMNDGGAVSLESGFTGEAIQELTRRGHKVDDKKGAFGGYQAIWRDPGSGVYAGASESRKDGQAAGY